MSQAPMAVYGHEVRWGTRLGAPTEMKDTLWAGLSDSYTGTPMGITAENLASDYDITRAESDAYALESQTRWTAAHERGAFKDEISAIELKSRKGCALEDPDPRPPHALLSPVGHDVFSGVVVPLAGPYRSTPTNTRAQRRSRRWVSCRRHSRRTVS
jgi:hypothetical protein